MSDFSVRLDKWLWAVRIYKTRSDAADGCRNNKVLVNGAYSKPSRELKPGDTVTVKKMPVTYRRASRPKTSRSTPRTSRRRRSSTS